MVQCFKTFPPSYTHRKPFALLLCYIYQFISLHTITCQIQQTKNDVIYLQSFKGTYLVLTLLSHPIPIHMSWLQQRKGDLHFILSDNSNYNFDVKVGCCRFVGFVIDVIDCGCLGCVFYFRIKAKEKHILYQILEKNVHTPPEL